MPSIFYTLSQAAQHQRQTGRGKQVTQTQRETQRPTHRPTCHQDSPDAAAAQHRSTQDSSTATQLSCRPTPQGAQGAHAQSRRNQHALLPSTLPQAYQPLISSGVPQRQLQLCVFFPAAVGTRGPRHTADPSCVLCRPCSSLSFPSSLPYSPLPPCGTRHKAAQPLASSRVYTWPAFGAKQCDKMNRDSKRD